MKQTKHTPVKQEGLVLATNLILLLLLTLIVNALYKNAALQHRMSTHHNLLSGAKNHARQAIDLAKRKVDQMVMDEVDLLQPSKGYYPLNHQLNINDVTNLADDQVLTDNNSSRYIIMYLGKSKKHLISTSITEFHLFKIISFSKSSKGTEYVEQQLFSVPTVNIQTKKPSSKLPIA